MPIPTPRKLSTFKNPQVVYNPSPRPVPNAETEEGTSYVQRTLGNVPGSAMNLAGGLWNAVTNPAETIRGVGAIAGGAVDKLLPGEQGGEKNFDALVDFYKERYGSVDQFLKTLEEDPVGVAADASLVLGGAGAVLKGAGTISKVGTLSRAGSLVSRAGQLTNPINAVTGLTSGATKAFPYLARSLEKMNMRLTPVQKAALGDKVNELADHANKLGIVGTPTIRLNKVRGMLKVTEDTLQDFFSHMSKGSGANQQEVVQALQGLKGGFKNDRDFAVISRQIDSAINQVKRMGRDGKIKYGDLNQFKRSTYENAYNKAGEKVLDDVEHAIGDVVRNKIEQDLIGLKVQGLPIGEFNKDYGRLLQLRKLYKIAAGRPQMSVITERLLGGLFGYGLGGPTGGFAGAALGHAAFQGMPATAVRSAAATGLTRINQGIALPPLVKSLLEASKTGALGLERVDEILPPSAQESVEGY